MQRLLHTSPIKNEFKDENNLVRLGIDNAKKQLRTKIPKIDIARSSHTLRKMMTNKIPDDTMNTLLKYRSLSKVNNILSGRTTRNDYEIMDISRSLSFATIRMAKTSRPESSTSRIEKFSKNNKNYSLGGISKIEGKIDVPINSLKEHFNNSEVEKHSLCPNLEIILSSVVNDKKNLLHMAYPQDKKLNEIDCDNKNENLTKTSKETSQIDEFDEVYPDYATLKTKVDSKQKIQRTSLKIPALTLCNFIKRSDSVNEGHTFLKNDKSGQQILNKSDRENIASKNKGFFPARKRSNKNEIQALETINNSISSKLYIIKILKSH